MKIAGGKLRVPLCAGGSAYAQATGWQVQTFATSVQSLIGFLRQTAGSTASWPIGLGIGMR